MALAMTQLWAIGEETEVNYPISLQMYFPLQNFHLLLWRLRFDFNTEAVASHGAVGIRVGGDSNLLPPPPKHGEWRKMPLPTSSMTTLTLMFLLECHCRKVMAFASTIDSSICSNPFFVRNFRRTLQNPLWPNSCSTCNLGF